MEIRWENKDVSLNVLYSQVHWAKRKKQRDEWHKFFIIKLLSYKRPTKETYKIEMRYNSRLDVSNTILMIKYLEDVIVKKLRWYKDDSPKYCKEITIKPDDRLKRKSYLVNIS